MHIILITLLLLALLFLSPVLMLLTRHPIPTAITVGLAVASVFVGFVLQLITLPVELDASFGKAMPILKAGYLKPDQHKEAKRILRTCALTYVADSLAGLLNFWRWLRVIGR